MPKPLKIADDLPRVDVSRGRMRFVYLIFPAFYLIIAVFWLINAVASLSNYRSPGADDRLGVDREAVDPSRSSSPRLRSLFSKLHKIGIL